MTAAAIVTEIEEIIEGLVTRCELQAYLFGSAMHAHSIWSDIDILIVCEADQDGQLARDALSGLCMLYPIDLMVMTSREEAEFDFVMSESCQHIATSRRLPLGNPLPRHSLSRCISAVRERR